ncbi:protein FAM174C [Lepisosteus oculatus]|uniref:protein FAM174C n=1 Tax=Lepisosteus oculatus TaxID=7918 RepID=UPI0003EA9F3D|nr:PREDICTED: uncharacterized membrane protein C19orf24 homolog [Lepisosteus oculatus]
MQLPVGLLSMVILRFVASAVTGDQNPENASLDSPANKTLNPTVSTTRNGHVNGTENGSKGYNDFSVNRSMIQRALYVLMGITVIGVVYFIVRAVRLRKTTTQRKKYGLLSNHDDTMEMAPLESDDDDTTVYEARSLRR